MGGLSRLEPPLELYNRPLNRFVAGFIGSPKMNFLSANVAENNGDSVCLAIDGGGALALPYAVPARAGDPVVVGIRPEHFEVLLDIPDSHRANIAVHVDLDEQLGGETYFYCSTKTGEQLTIHQPGQRPLSGGEQLQLAIPPAAVHVFDETGAMIANGRDAASGVS